MDVHILCAHSSINRHLQFSFLLLTNYAKMNMLIRVPHSYKYTCLSVGQTPRTVIVGLKGMCIKIKNSTKSSSPKATLIYIATRNLE